MKVDVTDIVTAKTTADSNMYELLDDVIRNTYDKKEIAGIIKPHLLTIFQAYALILNHNQLGNIERDRLCKSAEKHITRIAE
jgi:hypothetical protein